MEKNLEELKKTFIVDEGSFEEQELGNFIEKINKICKIDKTGHVSFIRQNITDKDKIKFILTARFLANRLEKEIPKEVTNEEIEKMLNNKPKEQIRARLSDLRREGLIKDLEKNRHEIKPFYLHKILIDKNKEVKANG